jgi:hypothetical protein
MCKTFCKHPVTIATAIIHAIPGIPGCNPSGCCWITPSEVYQPTVINKLTDMNKEKEAKRNLTTITTNEIIY